MKRIKLQPILTIAGKPFRVPNPEDGQVAEADLSQLLKLLIFNLPPQKITMQDSIHAYRAVQQIEKSADGVLSIEEAEHDWIKKVIETYAPQIFGVNAVMLKEAVENFERAVENQGRE